MIRRIGTLEIKRDGGRPYITNATWVEAAAFRTALISASNKVLPSSWGNLLLCEYRIGGTFELLRGGNRIPCGILENALEVVLREGFATRMADNAA